MQITSIIAIYGLFWVMCAFVMLPLGVKTADEVGAEKVRGQADSAPANFSGRKVVLRATVLAAVLCGLFVANYVEEWVVMDDINLFGEPPE